MNVKFPGTDPEEHSFSVFLGDLPSDVTLAAVSLNRQELVVPFENASRYTLIEESQEDDTHGYVLKVPLDDAVVTQQVNETPATSLKPSGDSSLDSCLVALQRRGCDALQTGHQLHVDGLAREEAVSPGGVGGAAVGCW